MCFRFLFEFLSFVFWTKKRLEPRFTWNKKFPLLNHHGVRSCEVKKNISILGMVKRDYQDNGDLILTVRILTNLKAYIYNINICISYNMYKLKTTAELGWSSHPYMWETFLEVLDLKSDRLENRVKKLGQVGCSGFLILTAHGNQLVQSNAATHLHLGNKKSGDKRYQGSQHWEFLGTFLLGWLKNHSNNWELRGLNMVEPSWLFFLKYLMSTCLCTHTVTILVTSVCWTWWCFSFSTLCSVSWALQSIPAKIWRCRV